jgi:hypothetical protein
LKTETSNRLYRADEVVQTGPTDPSLLQAQEVTDVLCERHQEVSTK